ncbi:unnamed protein product, partial [Musa hybrid cultivar]
MPTDGKRRHEPGNATWQAMIKEGWNYIWNSRERERERE